MPGSIGNRVRLSGKLIKGERRYVLQCEDESVWRLEISGQEVPKNARDVTIEGIQLSRDAVKVDWIGNSVSSR